MGKWMLRVLLSFPSRFLKLLLGEMMLSCIRTRVYSARDGNYFSNCVINDYDCKARLVRFRPVRRAI